MKLDHYPFGSRRMPVMATRAMVATSQPLAAQAGLQVMGRGGNAVDAAVASAIALAVMEPTSNGIGSDAFALVWDGTRLHGLNGSGRWPRALAADTLYAAGHTAVPERGWWPVTVPGAPALWGDLLERFGRLSFAEVAAPAIDYAENGYPVGPVVARNWRLYAAEVLALRGPEHAGFEPLFTRTGRAPAVGERWRSPDHARTLRALVTRGVRDFYEGSVAERIVAFARETGGRLAMDDLAAHASEWVQPISVSYRGHEVWEVPPNGQGVAALQALALVEGTGMDAHPHASEAAVHLQVEAMKLAFADAYRHVADPVAAAVPTAGLLAPEYLAARRVLIGERACVPEAGRPPASGTVYLCTADADGLMVSFIQSGYMDFGSGIVVPGTGICLQNRGACFTLEKGHPNEAAGGKRPRHTIIPGFLTRGGRACGPFGVMGGEMQPQGHLQVVTGMLDWELNPQAALDAPRWRVTDGNGVELEPGFAPGVAAGLAARGHAVSVDCPPDEFGRGQIISLLDDGVYVAGSEPRADGAAVGY